MMMEEEVEAQPVADCARGAEGGYVCRVDMAAGMGLFLVRFFDDALQFTGVRVMAFPASGVVNGALWEMVAAEVEAGGMAFRMPIAFSIATPRFTVSILSNSTTSSTVTPASENISSIAFRVGTSGSNAMKR